MTLHQTQSYDSHGYRTNTRRSVDDPSSLFFRWRGLIGHKVTLDTNLVVEYWRDQAKRETVQRLVDLATAGVVELAVTSRIRQDVRDPPLSESIDRLPELGIVETGSVTRNGYWQLGADQLGDDAFVAFTDRMSDRFLPDASRRPDWRDWDHLHAHYLQRRDVFLTWDRGILSLADDLAKEFSVSVMKPEDYLHTLGSGL